MAPPIGSDMIAASKQISVSRSVNSTVVNTPSPAAMDAPVNEKPIIVLVLVETLKPAS